MVLQVGRSTSTGKSSEARSANGLKWSRVSSQARIKIPCPAQPDHLAYFISDVVDQLDLSAITARYQGEERGGPPYHPRMMVKVLLYGYCTGVSSSRRIVQRLHEDIAFRVLAANNTPDFRTISDFRKEAKRFQRFTYDELVKRDKANLDIFWLRDESMEDTANLPPPDVIADEILEDLRTAIEQLEEIAADLATGAS